LVPFGRKTKRRRREKRGRRERELVLSRNKRRLKAMGLFLGQQGGGRWSVVWVLELEK
jgi:hypothetical protein